MYMGIIGRVTDRLRRGSRSQAAGTSSAGLDDVPGEAALAREWAQDERASLIDEELPRYEEIFDTGPLAHDHDSGSAARAGEKGRGKRVDPRRRHVLPSAGRLPSAVVDIMCIHGYLSPTAMFRISLLSQRLYDVVTPHLYRTVPIERGTFHKLLYGIPLPVQGFIYDPSSDGKSKGKEKEKEDGGKREQRRRHDYTGKTGHHRTESAISATSEARKRRCLTLVKEVWLESVIPDWTACRSLAILRHPERRFRDTSDNGPSELQYHPARWRPDLVKDKEKSGLFPDSVGQNSPTHAASLLMPNVETMHVRPEAIQAMLHWERVDRSPHPLPDALASLCEPTTVYVHGSVMALTLSRRQPDKIERAKLEVSIAKTIERLCTTGKRSSRVQTFVWHGVEADGLPYVPNCRMDIHFAPASTPISQSTMERIIQIRQALQGLNSSAPLHWRFHDPGIIDSDTENEHEVIVDAVLHGGLEGLDPLPEHVTSRVSFARTHFTYVTRTSPPSPPPLSKVTTYRYSRQERDDIARSRLLSMADARLDEVEPSLQNLYLQRTSTGPR